MGDSNGRVDEGETPIQAAAREVEEETGWRPGTLTPIVASQPSNGSMDAIHYLYRTNSAAYLGPPTDVTEADRVAWVPLAEIKDLIQKGQIVNGPTLISLLYVLAERGGFPT